MLENISPASTGKQEEKNNVKSIGCDQKRRFSGATSSCQGSLPKSTYPECHVGH